ncbi:unnamed protein product [Amoebophrya sp. A120]|nr:unnamed protein product [Amoebophrya sp. A120]|eukprot:GSA120T00013686001.1
MRSCRQRSVVFLSKDNRITNPSAYPVYSIFTNSKLRLEKMPLMEMRITNLRGIIANPHDNCRVGDVFTQDMTFCTCGASPGAPAPTRRRRLATTGWCTPGSCRSP